MRLPKAPARTTPGISFSIVQRALLDCIARREFGRREMGEALAFFGDHPPACAYCGDTPIARWDHVVPVMRGGDTVLGNVVPACGSCDDSKRDLPFEEWARSAAPRSPRTRNAPRLNERIAKVRAYVARYKYRPMSPEERMTADESRQLAEIRELLQRARRSSDALIAAYRRRTGLR